MVNTAEEYFWSSAAYHCGLAASTLLTPLTPEYKSVSSEEWFSWLALSEGRETIDIINRNIEKGLPCGSDSFITQLERLSKRPLQFRPQGRPNKGRPFNFPIYLINSSVCFFIRQKYVLKKSNQN